MATGDFGWLQQQLAAMAGVNSPTELDNNPTVPTDSLLVQQVINEAYLNCYYPQPWSGNPNPKRPRWAMQEFSIQLAAPITISVGVTQGSNVVTGSFTNAQIGSTLQLGANFYTYGGVDSSGNKYFVENVAEASGTYSCQLWNSATPITAATATCSRRRPVAKIPSTPRGSRRPSSCSPS